MHKITIRSVPDDMYEELIESAHRNRRSLDQEILFRIKQTPLSHPRHFSAEVVLRNIRRMREEMGLPLITDKFTNAAKKQGRL